MHSKSFRLPEEVPPSLCTLIEQFASNMLRVRGVASETAHIEVLYLIRFFRHFDFPDSVAELARVVSAKSIREFLHKYAAIHKPGSIRWIQISIRSFFRFAYCSELFDRDFSALVPVLSIRRFGMVPRGFPEEVIARLRREIDRSSPAGMRDAAIICLLAIYGVRGVQVRRLRFDDVDWYNERICFPAAKGGRAIEQHLLPEAGNLLSKYIRQARPKSEHSEVFLTLAKPAAPFPCSSYLSNIIKHRIEELKLELPEGVSLGTHGFRHAFACRMVGKIPFKELIDQLGHRDPASTLIYGKVDLDALSQAALPWPGGGQ